MVVACTSRSISAARVSRVLTAMRLRSSPDLRKTLYDKELFGVIK
jgi:hypothetical protein